MFVKIKLFFRQNVGLIFHQSLTATLRINFEWKGFLAVVAFSCESFTVKPRLKELWQSFSLMIVCYCDSFYNKTPTKAHQQKLSQKSTSTSLINPPTSRTFHKM
jgi:hypothetical protein